MERRANDAVYTHWTQHRLGSRSATGEANTWRTFTTCHVNRDGSGHVKVTRDGVVIHMFEFGPEEPRA